MRKTPQHVREKQLQELAVADGYTFIGWDGGYDNARSKIIISCPVHGEWLSDLSNFTRGSRCRKCYDSARIGDRIAREKQINDLALLNGGLFVGWVNGYKNIRSTAVINCGVHGEWSGPAYRLIYTGCSCFKCSRKQPSQVERERQLTDLAHADGYSFIGWVGEHANSRTKAVMNCNHHGEWVVRAKNFIHAGTRCPSCSLTGYQPSRSGVIYALLSECGQMVKIGISNVPRDRHTNLKRRTPFKFAVLRQLHCEDGSQPPILERLFHDTFPSAGLSGFDGATEWRLWHDDVNIWFDLLGG